METEVLKIQPENIDFEKIKYAANVLKQGGLVVFPTETVYGLGANGLDKKAVEKIFLAKGRPQDNPLILHLAQKEQMDSLVKDNNLAIKLIEQFWPGPLTLVMEKTKLVPDEVSANLSTVAARMPFHPVALSLIYETGLPIAAPSANKSGRPSPTRVEHCLADLDGLVDVIIDSGNCKVGLESTVLDISSTPPTILRPGGISVEQIKDVVGDVLIHKGVVNNEENGAPKSPGMKYTHYSPKAQLLVVCGDLEKVVTKIKQLCLNEKDKKIGILATDETINLYKQNNQSECKSAVIMSVGSRADKSTIAAKFFDALRKFDDKNVDIVFSEAVDEDGMGLAIMNRMNKASGYNKVDA